MTQQRFLKTGLTFLLAAGLYYVFVQYALPFFFPLMCAFVTVAVLNRPAQSICHRSRLKPGLCCLLVTIAAFLLLGIGIFFAVRWVSPLAVNFLSSLPKLWEQSLLPLYQRAERLVLLTVEKLPAQTAKAISTAFAHFSQSFVQWVSSVGGKAFGAVSRALPKIIMSFGFYFVCSLLLAADYNRITGSVKAALALPEAKTIGSVLYHLKNVLFGMLKAELQLVFCTFLVVTGGLFMLGYAHPVTVAFFISFVDLLPVLGAGAVLVPWGIIGILTQNTVFGIGLLVLSGVVFVTRSVMEPHLTGKQVGLPPVFSLILAFLGARIFGFWGIFVLPLTGALVLDFLRCKFDIAPKNRYTIYQ